MRCPASLVEGMFLEPSEGSSELGAPGPARIQIYFFSDIN